MLKLCKSIERERYDLQSTQAGNLEKPCVSVVHDMSWSKDMVSFILTYFIYLKTKPAAHRQLKEMCVSRGLFIPSALDMYLELEWADLFRSIDYWRILF